jgi:alpha-ketoglutarate-dependent taurine dioxygenase
MVPSPRTGSSRHIKMTDYGLIQLEEFNFDGQQDTVTFGYSESKRFPLALQTKAGAQLTIEEAVEGISALRKSGKIAELVRAHGGAALIRGLPITTPSEYSQVAHAFGLAAHEEVGRPPLRTVLAKNVKTANEGPPDLPIWPHNEYGWSTINPAWLTFCALEVPQIGGATPLTSSIGLAKKLEDKAPDLMQKLSTHGVQYMYRYSRKEVVSTVGATVFAAYGQDIRPGDDEATIRQKVEREVKRHSNRFQWNEDGSLSVTHIVPSESLSTTDVDILISDSHSQTP